MWRSCFRIGSGIGPGAEPGFSLERLRAWAMGARLAAARGQARRGAERDPVDGAHEVTGIAGAVGDVDCDDWRHEAGQ
jgi:hypothetical protein